MISPKLIIDRLNSSKWKIIKHYKYDQILIEGLREEIFRMIDDHFEFDENKYQKCLSASILESNVTEIIFNSSNIEASLNEAKNSILFDKTIIKKMEQSFILNSSKAIKNFQKYFDNIINKRTYKLYFMHWSSRNETNMISKLNGFIETYVKLSRINKYFVNGASRCLGFLSELDIREIRKLEETLSNNNFIEQIAEYLGRFEESQTKYIEENVKVQRNKYNPKLNTASPENTTGIKYGNNISTILPHQLALRNNSLSKNLFKINFAEKKLIELKQEKNISDFVEINKKIQKPLRDKRGPIIICVDTSGSMYGLPENIAKAMTLLLVNIALKEKRECYIIAFSVKILVIDILEIKKNYKTFIKFLTGTIRGGTDIQLAFEAAIKLTETPRYSNADIFTISDMQISQINDDLKDQIAKSKLTGTRFMGLSIEITSIHMKPLDFFDKYWVFDGTEESIKKIIKSLNE